MTEADGGISEPDAGARPRLSMGRVLRWAAYAFERYREGMTQAPLSDTPQIVAVRGDHILTHTVTLPGDVLGDGVAAGISAVIEEAGGHKSYWALAHAPGQPDFHNAACFTLAIGAAEAP